MLGNTEGRRRRGRQRMRWLDGMHDCPAGSSEDCSRGQDGRSGEKHGGRKKEKRSPLSKMVMWCHWLVPLMVVPEVRFSDLPLRWYIFHVGMF